MLMIRGSLLALVFLALAGSGVMTARGGFRFANAAAHQFMPFGPPQTTATATTAGPARVASFPSPASSPRSILAAASPVAVASEIVAVASQADQKVTLVDSATGKTSSFDLGMPVASMALAPNGRTAWAFSSKPGEGDFLIVDLLKGERKEGKRLHDNPSAAAFSADGRRAYVSLVGGNDSPPVQNSIVFLNTNNIDEFGHIDVGEQSPGVQIHRQLVALGVAPGPAGEVLYAAGLGSGTVWALDAGSGKLLQQIEVGGGAIGVLSEPARKRVYVVADTINQIVAVDTTTQLIAGRLSLPGRPSAAAVAPDGKVDITVRYAGPLLP